MTLKSTSVYIFKNFKNSVQCFFYSQSNLQNTANCVIRFQLTSVKQRKLMSHSKSKQKVVSTNTACCYFTFCNYLFCYNSETFNSSDIELQIIYYLIFNGFCSVIGRNFDPLIKTLMDQLIKKRNCPIKLII